MPQIESNIIDVFVFRCVRERIQFLLLRRGPTLQMAGSWQSIHGRVDREETAVDAAIRQVRQCTGFEAETIYSADYVSQFYDPSRDSIMLAPSFAVLIESRSQPRVSAEFDDYAWCDLEETTARLAMSSHRWAIRHIHDVIALGGREADLYRI